MKEGEIKRGVTIPFILIIILIFFGIYSFFNFPLTGYFTKDGTVYTCENCSDCNASIIDASPGDTIYLNKTISGVVGTCINFSAKDDLTFDCQNNSIIGDGVSQDYGFYFSSANNNLIRNCNNISYFYSAIYSYYSSNNTFLNITANNNTIAIYLDFYSNNSYIKNTVTNNNSVGVGFADFAGKNTVINATANHNSLYGFYSTEHNITFINVSANQNRYGIYLDSSSRNNTILNSTANNNTIGIFVQFSNNNTLMNIIVTNNSESGVSLGSSRNNTLRNIISNNNTIGVDLAGSNNNTLINITANSNTNYGIRFTSGSSSNVLRNSFVQYSALYGLYFDRLAAQYSRYNIIYNNYFNNTAQYYNTTNMTNYFNTSKTAGTNIVGGDYLGGNYWAALNGTGFSQTCSLSTDGICDTAFSLDGLNYDYLPLTCIESWTCGAWSTCTENRQTRTCVDSNLCQTYKYKPIISQFCEDIFGGGETAPAIQEITPETPVEISVTNQEAGVTSIIVQTTETVSGASVTVSSANSPSSSAIGKSGDSYSSFSIKTKRLNDLNIKNATINFKVNKTWMRDGNWTNNDVRLYRNKDNTTKWDILNTTFVNEDENYSHFFAVSPGFSTFVVFLGTYECTPGGVRCFEDNVQLCLGNSTWLVTENCPIRCQEGKCTATAPISLVIYTVIIAGISIAILFTIYFTLKNIFGKKKR